jgi:uncharacterized protein
MRLWLNAPLQRIALFALRFYKMYLSAQFGGTCRFEPSCSMYAIEAVQRFGARRGCWLTLKRLARCQPLSRKFGYDPVPETWPLAEADAATFRDGQKPGVISSLIGQLCGFGQDNLKLRSPKDKEAHS